MKRMITLNVNDVQSLYDLTQDYNNELEQYQGELDFSTDYAGAVEKGESTCHFWISDLCFVVCNFLYKKYHDRSYFCIGRRSGELEYHISMPNWLESAQDVEDVRQGLGRIDACKAIYERYINDVMSFDIESGASVTDSVKVKDNALDDEMAMWEQRSNDEFGQVIKQIENYFKEYVGETQSEYEGIKETPITWVVASYGLDGNKRSVANKIYNTVVDYDLYGNGDSEFDALVDKMTQLAM